MNVVWQSIGELRELTGAIQEKGHKMGKREHYPFITGSLIGLTDNLGCSGEGTNKV
jgi:hypothetical protein